jgi:hypothetical protein
LEPLDWNRKYLLDRFFHHFECDTDLLIHPQHLVGYLHLVVHVRTYQYLLVTSQLEDTMGVASEDRCGMLKLRHHDDDHLFDDRRVIHVAEGTHRHLQRPEQHFERAIHVR